MSVKQTILIADDQADIREALQLLLASHGYQVIQAAEPLTVLEAVKHDTPDMVLLDMNYRRDTTSGKEGLALLQQLKDQDQSLTVIVMTAWGSVELAMQAVHLGADDFIEKPWNNNRLLNIINTQFKHRSIARNQQRYKAIANLQRQRDDLIADSVPMQTLLQALQQVAPSQATVLLHGENGTGKNLLAEQLHQWSERAEGALVSVNMGSIPEALFESEMFGHIKGAFTDAREARIGRFELADGGTLFLDEIGNLPLPQQAKLLRVLESGDFEKVGASKTQTADVRVIAASNADLPAMVESGAFRRDLYFRLNTVELHIPPLRERGEDIRQLADHYLAQHQRRYKKASLKFDSEALSALSAYHWPGNVRELSHVIERAVLLTQSHIISTAALNINVTPAAIAAQAESVLSDSLEVVEKNHIQSVLSQYHGSVETAAAVLGVSRSALYRRMDKFGIANKADM